MAQLLFLVLIQLSCKSDNNMDRGIVRKAMNPVTIDGVDTEKDWDKASWQDIDQVWLGELQDQHDFKGRYKLLWDADYLYVLAEVFDDTLVDFNQNPLERYWDDDCLEIFIDQDASGGIHQYNHSAFAYHLGLKGEVVDIAPDSIPRLYSDHVIFERKTSGTRSLWEMAIRIFDEDFVDDAKNTPVILSQDAIMGFAIAYCDNDNSPERECFIGSEIIEGEDKNRGWIDASVFGRIQLKS